MKRVVSTVVLLLLAVPVLGAGIHPIDRKLTTCMEKDETTAGMMNCLGAAYAAWDKELNAAYKRLGEKLDPKQKEALKAAQRSWLAYRDSEFALIDAFYGGLDGTMYRPMRTNDRVEIVKQRALALAGYVEILESSK